MNDTQSTLLQLLRENEQMSRVQLSKRLGISLMGISKVLSTLSRNHLITLSKDFREGRGRQADIVQIAEDGGYTLGIAVKTIDVEITLVNFQNKIISFKRIPYIFRAQPAVPTPSDVMPILSRIRKMLSLVPHERLFAVGMSISGDFEFASGHILRTNDFVSPGQAETLRGILSKETGLPVTIVHDTEAGLLAERWCNRALPSNPTLLYICDRLGLSLMFEGRLFRGSPIWTRWLGRWQVEGASEGTQDFFSNSLAATAYYVAWFSRYHDRPFCYENALEPETERKERSEFYSCWLAGDKRSKEIVQRGLTDLAHVIRNFASTTLYDRIIVNGWIPEIRQLAVEEISRVLHESNRVHPFPVPEFMPSVSSSILGDQTEAAGAAFFALDQLLNSRMVIRGWKKDPTADSKPRGVKIK